MTNPFNEEQASIGHHRPSSTPTSARNDGDAKKIATSRLEGVAEVLRGMFPGISQRDAAEYENDGGDYAPAPELIRNEGVPQGSLVRSSLPAGSVYPGVDHEYTVYLPQQYRSKSPAAMMVFLDGDGFLGPTSPMSFNAVPLLDNLIHEKSIPVMIGVFLNPGKVGPGFPIYGGNDNRSVEYDTADGTFASFLVDELLRVLASEYSISQDPERRGILGASSGGSAAFGVAWHRPDQFRKVISSIGSFVGIRGAHIYPYAVRQSAPKPLRIFLQDGRRDLNTVLGNWPLANQTMASALSYQGYDYRFEFGEGGHNYFHLAHVIPEALRWLWRDLKPA